MRVLVSAVVLASLALASPLRADDQQPIKLFNGKDMTGWTFFLNDKNAKMEDVWHVTPEDGVLHCKGHPIGYIRTEKSFENYKLHVEWRNPGKPGNSGVLLRMQPPDKVWPKSIECQLNSGDAGDIWNIDKVKMTVAQDRTEGRRTKKLHESNEKPLGEWNNYDITMDGTNLELKVNGEVQNTATDVEVMSGPILLQSEGAEIEFRNIELTPLAGEHSSAGASSSASPNADTEWKRLEGLEGWHVIGKGNWTYHDGIIEGSQAKDTKTYTHVVTDKSYKNLRAALKFKIPQGNSGFYYRAMVDDKGLMHGIQCEIDEARDPGALYESYGRNWVAHPGPEQWKKYFKPQEWNEMTCEVIGTHVKTTVNGQTAVDIDDPQGRKEGVCALQIHGGQDVHVMFKDIKIEELPE